MSPPTGSANDAAPARFEEVQTVTPGPQTGGTAVVDSSSFGRLYASPLTLARFEQDAGATNQSTARLEGHAASGSSARLRRCALRRTNTRPAEAGLVRSDAASD